MNVQHVDAIAASRGDTFTGEVALKRIVAMHDPAGMAVSPVRFEDGARTNRHLPAGEQILIVVEGEGRAGDGTEERANLGPGTVLHLPASERHWHGAMPGRSMAHYSITTSGPATRCRPPDE